MPKSPNVVNSETDDEKYTHGLPRFVPGTTVNLLAQEPGTLRETPREQWLPGDEYLLNHLKARYGHKPFSRGLIDVGRLNRLLGREILFVTLPDSMTSPETKLAVARVIPDRLRDSYGGYWSDIECYFAVWSYDRLDVDRRIVKQHLYEEIGELIRRTPKSVAYKIQNVSYFDPRPRDEKPVAIAKNAQALLGTMFKWYWTDRDFARAQYSTFLEHLQLGTHFDLEAEPTEEIDTIGNHALLIEEGNQSTASRSVRRRSRALVAKAREHFMRLDAEGRLRCQACGFSAPDKIAETNLVVHLHHTKPIYLAEAKGRSTPLADAIASLCPLCPTCHAIAHTTRPPLSLDAIKNISRK